MEEHMLTLYIQSKTQTIVTKDKRTATTYCVDADQSGVRRDLHDLPVMYEIEGLKIFDARKNRPALVPLPPHVCDALLKYLRSYHAREDWSFDCLSLANLVAGLPTYPKHLLWRFWNKIPMKFGPLTYQQVKPGDVVLLMKKNTFHHAAINIGDDLYVSVWGAGGDLEFASLRMMERAYGSIQILRATPRG